MVKKPILKFQEHILPTFNDIWGSFRHLVAYESNTNRFGEKKKNIKEIENILKKSVAKIVDEVSEYQINQILNVGRKRRDGNSKNYVLRGTGRNMNCEFAGQEFTGKKTENWRLKTLIKSNIVRYRYSFLLNISIWISNFNGKYEKIFRKASGSKRDLPMIGNTRK